MHQRSRISVSEQSGGGVDRVRGTAPRALLAAIVIALLVLLSSAGGAVAGALVTGAQIKDGTVSSADVKNRSLGSVDLSRGTIRELRGARGARGARGLRGETGADGPAGTSGPAGDTGPAGATGPVGETGPTGATGPAGPAGPSGSTYLGTATFSVFLNPGECGKTATLKSAAPGDLVLIVPDYAGTYPGSVFIAPGFVKNANTVPFAICNHGATSVTLNNVVYRFWRLSGS